jgi:hypothetical protein
VFYTVVLVLHNLLRWVVVLTAAWALMRAWSGWLGKRPWSKADRQAGAFFGISLDVQLLLGLILAFISPILRAAYGDLGSLAMQDPFRFFLIEHMPVMVAAVFLVHIGTAAARKGADDTAKHRRAAIWFTLAALAIAIAIPWFRPLLRL